MLIQNGVKDKKVLKPSPRRVVHKRQSVHALFGSVTEFPESYLVDDTGFPSQRADNRNNECTWYAQADAFLSIFGIEISRDFGFYKTLQAENQSDDGEVSMDTAFAIPSSIGVILKSQEPSGIPQMSEQQIVLPTTWDNALDGQTRRLPPGIPIIPAPGQDWYDAIKSALVKGMPWKGKVAIGTQWSQDFETIGNDGILPDNPRNLVWGHCHLACGWEKNGDGMERLNDKSFQGTSYGKGGWAFASRPLINKLMSVWGAQAVLLTNQPQPEAAKRNIIQILLDYLLALYYAVGNAWHMTLYEQIKEELQTIENELTNLLHKPMPQPMNPIPAPVPPPAPVTPTHTNMIVKWSQAIAQGEGADPASNNPGNLKLSTLTASWGATRGRAATDGGYLCHFATPQMGQAALCNFLTLGAENELIAFHHARTLQAFTEVYAGNPPQGYINRIAEYLGVPLNTNIATFL